MFAYHPADTIHNIAFSTAIGAYNSGDTFIKIKYGFIGKTLKSLDF